MYRERPPQLDGGVVLTDGGIERTLIGCCCGTDKRHADAICGASRADTPART